MSVGERVKSLREQINLSISELAEKAGLTRSYVWQIEKGDNRNPSADALYRIARVLNVTVGELLEEPVVVSDESAARELPPGLKDFIEERGRLQQPIPYEDILALTTVEFRGRRPSTKEEWSSLYELLKMSSQVWKDG